MNRSPHRPTRHQFLPELSIVQDDRIDNCPTLHTTLRGKLELAGAVQQIHAEVINHEPAASGAR
jgi:hypothetical protein